MQLSKMFKASSKSGRSVIASLVMVAVAATVLSFVPTHGAANTLAETCANPPSTPTLNYWPVTYNSVNTPLCHDFSAIDAAIDVPNPTFSANQADWNNGLQMTYGQKGVALMYIHNGAANNLDPEQTTARDVKVTTVTDTSVGSTHSITATFTASNAATHSKTFTIHTPADSKLEVVPNSGYAFDYEGNQIPGRGGLNIGNSTLSLGDLNACFEYSLFFSFKFKVVQVTPPTTETPTLSIDKLVKNMTDDTAYANTVNADKGDKVGYQIKVKNNGPVVAKNVKVTDNGVSGVSIDSGSTTVSINNNNVQRGNIPGTINLGDMQPGQEITITYTGKVTSNDCDTLTNTARAIADNAPQVSDTAAVKVKCDTNPNNPDLDIKKSVYNQSTNTDYNNSSVDARTGERVRFKVSVTNSGDTTLQNVRMTDRIPNGLQFDDSVSGDGTASFNNNTFSVNFGSMAKNTTKTVEFSAKVLATGSTTICNVAKATATGVDEVEDDACVKVYTTSKPGTPNIVLSKRAFNDTKNVDATTVSAARGDYITYSLVTTNTGTADQTGYVIKDDLSQVLPLADMISANGGTVSGNVISYPSMTIKAGETVTKTFKVRIKQTLDKNLTYQLKNVYGNTVIINVPGTVVYQAPTTGAAGTSAGIFAGLVTAGFVVARKRNSILKFIFA